jgi:pimeloyl-ACP methyl ester carboxylesterase
VRSRLAAHAAALTVLCASVIGGTGAVPASAGSAPDSGAPDHGAAALAAPDIVTAPTLIARTADGDVGYREVGSGSPLLLIMGYSGTMDDWAPSFVDSLAENHTVIAMDNAGVGDTSALPGTLSISAMARQASALISALRLHRTAVLGWSMGGMIAQALAARDPGQVSALILAATQPGTGNALPIPAAAQEAAASPDPATVLSALFPADQPAAELAYAEGITQYPDRYTTSPTVEAEQNTAIARWMAGHDPAGRGLSRIRVRTLVADGTEDEFDPVANDQMLASGIRDARLLLYPDAGHAFLFQDSAAFVPAVQRFLCR